jgi:CheY-like chemotaxis protein
MAARRRRQHMMIAMTQRRPRVLVVDDDHDLRASLAEALEDSGYAVAQAVNGQQGLEVLRAAGPDERPDVVLLDLLMPVVNGWQFCEAKGGDPATAAIPVIVMSGAASRDPQSPYYIDVQDFIAKPVELGELLPKLAGCLKGADGG